MTPVLNVSRDEIVLLPTDNALVIRQAKTFLIEELGLLGIEDEDYDELASVLSLPDLTGDETKQYFVKRCRTVAGYGTAFLSCRGYEEIFDVLEEANYNIKMMISELPAILNSWQEDTPTDMLKYLSIDHSGMNAEEVTALAIKAINDHDRMGYEAEYEVDGITTLLYSDG